MKYEVVLYTPTGIEKFLCVEVERNFYGALRLNLDGAESIELYPGQFPYTVRPLL